MSREAEYGIRTGHTVVQGHEDGDLASGSVIMMETSHVRHASAAFLLRGVSIHAL